LVSVTWAYTIFRFFETFCEHAPQGKLRGEKNRIFWTYGSKFMDVWNFKEKSRHVLEPTSKSWPLAQKVEGMKKKKFKKNGNSPTSPCVNLRPAGDRWSLAGPRPPTGGRRPLAAQGRPATSGRPPVAGWCLDMWGYSHFLEIF
jgi:hypothetical protein